MKFIFLILVLLLCSCQNSWEQSFVERGYEALGNEQVYDANFYFLEVEKNGNEQLLEAKLGLDAVRGFSPKSNQNRVVNDLEKVQSNENKLNEIIIPLYYHTGNVESHVALLKAMSKDYDHERRGYNLLLRLSNYDAPAAELGEEDAFGDEDGFGDEEAFDLEADKSSNNLYYLKHTIIKENCTLEELIKAISDNFKLRYKTTEHATILTDYMGFSCCGTVMFYDLLDYNVSNNLSLFYEYCRKIIKPWAGSELQYISSVNRLVVKDSDTNHSLIESFLIPNFTKYIELNFYSSKIQIDNKISRADLEKNIDNQFKNLSSEKIELIYKKPRTYDGFKFNYFVKDNIQWIKIERGEKSWTLSFLKVVDKVIPLDDDKVLFIKVR